MLIALRPFRFGFVANLKYMALGIALILATFGVVSSLGLSPELYSQVLFACIAVEIVAVIALGAWTGRTVWSLRLEPQGVALVTRNGAVVDEARWPGAAMGAGAALPRRRGVLPQRPRGDAHLPVGAPGEALPPRRRRQRRAAPARERTTRVLCDP
ncbi:MAG: hypothetical protein EPO40_12680 [Myxococcaceae bacterium]|nr:MAG: hypothetical protein EPO40_12680 [Myxococcaceae bacterium]